MEARRRHILGEIDQLEEWLQMVIEMIPQISNEIDELQRMDLDPLLLELRLACKIARKRICGSGNEEAGETGEQTCRSLDQKVRYIFL